MTDSRACTLTSSYVLGKAGLMGMTIVVDVDQSNFLALQEGCSIGSPFPLLLSFACS